MLVLTRKISESFMIGEDVEVSVLKIMGDKVRFGIKAPSNIAVHRREVWEEIRKENLAATQVNITGLGSISRELDKSRTENPESPGTTLEND